MAQPLRNRVQKDQADERLRVALQRKAYYDARKDGLTHAEASEVANAMEDHTVDLKAKADREGLGTPGGPTPRYRPKSIEAEPEPEEIDATNTDTTPQVPDDWKDLPWPKMKALAHHIKPFNATNKKQAMEVISEAYKKQQRKRRKQDQSED